MDHAHHLVVKGYVKSLLYTWANNLFFLIRKPNAYLN